MFGTSLKIFLVSALLSAMLLHSCALLQGDSGSSGPRGSQVLLLLSDHWHLWHLISHQLIKKNMSWEREKRGSKKKKGVTVAVFFKQEFRPTEDTNTRTFFFFFFSSQSQKVLTKYHTTCFQAVLLVNADMDKHNHAIYQQNKVNLLTKSFWFQ